MNPIVERLRARANNFHARRTLGYARTEYQVKDEALDTEAADLIERLSSPVDGAMETSPEIRASQAIIHKGMGMDDVFTARLIRDVDRLTAALAAEKERGDGLEAARVKAVEALKEADILIEGWITGEEILCSIDPDDIGRFRTHVERCRERAALNTEGQP